MVDKVNRAPGPCILGAGFASLIMFTYPSRQISGDPGIEATILAAYNVDIPGCVVVFYQWALSQ